MDKKENLPYQAHELAREIPIVSGATKPLNYLDANQFFAVLEGDNPELVHTISENIKQAQRETNANPDIKRGEDGSYYVTEIQLYALQALAGIRAATGALAEVAKTHRMIEELRQMTSPTEEQSK